MRGSLLLLLVIYVSVAIVSGGRGKKSKKPKSRGDKTGDDRYRIPEVMPGLRSPQQMLVRSGKVDNERQLKVLKRKDFHKNKFGDTFDHMTPISLASALDDLEPENRPDATVSVVKLGQQTSDGIPVFGRTVTMMLDADGLSTQISEQGLIKNLDAKVEQLKKRSAMSRRSAIKACAIKLKLPAKGIGRSFDISSEYNVYAFPKKNRAGNNRRHGGNNTALYFSSTDDTDDVTLMYDFSFNSKSTQNNNERNNGRFGNKKIKFGNKKQKGSNSNDQPSLSSYRCLVDIVNRKVLTAYDALIAANSRGGTVNNPWGYGDLGEREPLDVVQSTSGQCSMQTPSEANKNLPSQQGFITYACENKFCRSPELYSFDCQTGPTDIINGGLGPYSDTFYHLSKAYDSLIELGANHSDIIEGDKLRVWVVGPAESFANAYFMGMGSNSRLAFYSGATGIDHPLGICADVAAHELGHSVTYTTSELVYSGESGCLNEAFSDWMGEYVELKIAGDIDWLVGADCLRTPFRSFEEPTRFNQIDHYSDFGRDPDPDPHWCSGILNRMFYNLCQMPDWDITKAFRTALYAQTIYWNNMITMHDAGCGMLSVVAPNNQKIQDITTAFSIVGLDLTDCSSYVEPSDPSPPSPTTPIPIPTTVGDTVPPGTSSLPPFIPTTTPALPPGFLWCQSLRGLSANEGVQQHYTIGEVMNYDVLIAIEGDNGDADVYIRTKGKVSTKKWDYRMDSSGSVGDIVIRNVNSRNFVFMIHASQAYQDLTLKVCIG